MAAAVKPLEEYAFSDGSIHVGAKMQVRDGEEFSWKDGVVTEVEPEGFLRIMPKGWDKAFRWKFCKDAAGVPVPTKVSHTVEDAAPKVHPAPKASGIVTTAAAAAKPQESDMGADCGSSSRSYSSSSRSSSSSLRSNREDHVQEHRISFYEQPALQPQVGTGLLQQASSDSTHVPYLDRPPPNMAHGAQALRAALLKSLFHKVRASSVKAVISPFDMHQSSSSELPNKGSKRPRSDDNARSTGRVLNRLRGGQENLKGTIPKSAAKPLSSDRLPSEFVRAPNDTMDGSHPSKSRKEPFLQYAGTFPKSQPSKPPPQVGLNNNISAGEFAVNEEAELLSKSASIAWIDLDDEPKKPVLRVKWIGPVEGSTVLNSWYDLLSAWAKPDRCVCTDISADSALVEFEDTKAVGTHELVGPRRRAAFLAMAISLAYRGTDMNSKNFEDLPLVLRAFLQTAHQKRRDGK